MIEFFEINDKYTGAREFYLEKWHGSTAKLYPNGRIVLNISTGCDKHQLLLDKAVSEKKKGLRKC